MSSHNDSYCKRMTIANASLAFQYFVDYRVGNDDHIAYCRGEWVLYRLKFCASLHYANHMALKWVLRWCETMQTKQQDNRYFSDKMTELWHRQSQNYTIILVDNITIPQSVSVLNIVLLLIFIRIGLFIYLFYLLFDFPRLRFFTMWKTNREIIITIIVSINIEYIIEYLMIH